MVLEMGYKVTKVYEIWHFETRSYELFRGYINMFLKKKQGASGWLAWCKSEDDKQRNIQNYRNAEGI